MRSLERFDKILAGILAKDPSNNPLLSEKRKKIIKSTLSVASDDGCASPHWKKRVLFDATKLERDGDIAQP